MGAKPTEVILHFQRAFTDMRAPHQVVGVMKTHKGGHQLSVRGPDGKTKPVNFPHRASDEQIVRALRKNFGDRGLPSAETLATGP